MFVTHPKEFFVQEFFFSSKQQQIKEEEEEAASTFLTIHDVMHDVGEMFLFFSLLELKNVVFG